MGIYTVNILTVGQAAKGHINVKILKKDYLSAAIYDRGLIFFWEDSSEHWAILPSKYFVVENQKLYIQ